ncbi:MAG: pseudaminic acid synthase, partial [Pseudomonadota bacterium]
MHITKTIMPPSISINGHAISAKNPPYIIAEISANHNGSLERFFKLIKTAKHTGANAVKIQTYTPDTMTINIRNDDFLIKDGLWKNRSLYDLYQESFTPFEWHKPIFEFAEQQHITLFSSPFDETAVDLLEKLGAPAYKIASFELVDLPLISYIAKTKKPMLISTGMANLTEISEAVETAKSAGCKDIALLHCISSYPTSIDQSNLHAIKYLQKKFDLPIGLSDHTTSSLTSIVATALGANIIEKHFTLSRKGGGVDSCFSIEPHEMETLITDTKKTHAALGNQHEIRSKSEQANKMFRRSLYFVKDLKRGELITTNHIKKIRPGFGLS